MKHKIRIVILALAVLSLLLLSGCTKPRECTLKISHTDDGMETHMDNCPINKWCDAEIPRLDTKKDLDGRNWAVDGIYYGFCNTRSGVIPGIR